MKRKTVHKSLIEVALEKLKMEVLKKSEMSDKLIVKKNIIYTVSHFKS